MQNIQCTFEAIGTVWVIDLFVTPSKLNKDKLFKLIRRRIDVFDKAYSRFRDDSFVSKMAKNKGKYIFPKDGVPLLSLYKDLYSVTDHSFTPFIGAVLEDAGYGKAYSLKPKKIIKPTLKWDEVIEKINGRKIELIKSAMFDFGAAGKGYIVDLIGELLKKNKIESFCVDAGGDILYVSKEKSIRVGLENPVNKGQVIGVVEFKNKSICGSSGNRRKWNIYNHIINPHTLSSPDHILATWTISNKTIIADAMSTALFFTNGKVLQNQYDFEYCVLHRDFSIERSTKFPGEFFHEKTNVKNTYA